MGVRESDEDSFTVRASNEDGAVSYCTTRLTVEHDHQEDSPDGSPKFLIGMKNTAVLEKTFLRFMVKVSGSPKPEVKFYKDDRFITSANQRVKIDKSRSSAGYYELILPQVTEEDAGQYKCIAMNEHGEAESEATLSVTDDKTIFYGLENSDLLKSGETPQFQWLRDGQPFQPEDRFKVDYKDEGDSLQLVFQNVKPEDAGLYTCVGTTSTGRLACSAELTIQGSVNQLAREPMAPKMTAESKTFESSLGSTAMMEFTCEGFPKPYLKLEKDGKEIETGGKCKFMYESDENVILAIKKLEPEDSGKYTVEAMNELGSSTQEFNLSIKAPPKYRNKLGDGEDVNIMVGQELKLSIGIDGIPKPEVKWLKDGKPVKETKDLVLSYDDSGVHTLTIEKATLKDSGSYSVTATNEMSTITDFTRVTVHAPPQFLRTMTKAVDCNIGDTITYQIKVEGDPLPDVKWMKDNEPLQIDEQHLKVTADGQVHSLIINKVKREDSGKYSALITNDHGSSQDDGRMNVRCAPLFTKKLEDFTALEGDQNVEFTVDIECYPKPVVKWFHDKTEITEKLSEFTKVEETDGHTYKLILSQVEREHAGKYICEVSNNLGKLKCDANFVVKAKPRFKKTLPETVEIDEGQSLSLSIEVEAVPEPEVKWYRNGQEITADANIKITRDSKRIEDYHLTVTLVKPEDGGEYEVRASNEVGSAVTKSRVLVHSVTKSKQADETEEGEAETKRLSNRQRKAGIYGFDSDDENEVDRKKSISNEKADDGEVIVTSRGKTTTKRKVTVTHDGVEKVLEDSIVESSYGNDAERRQVKGPTVEEFEDETSPRVRKTSKRESYVREDSRQSVAEAEKVDVDFETRITGEVEVEAKVNDIEMKTRITGEVDVDNSNVNSRRTSRQASETEEPTCQQRRISKPGDDVRMVVEEGPVIEKPNATTPSDAKQKKRKWSITTAQVESYIPEESDNLDDEIYQTALGERLRRKFTKKDEDDNLKLTIYEITDGPTGEKSQKVKVSKDENLQHPRIDIYETKKPKISYSSSIDELDESDEEPAVAMDSTKLTRDGSSKDVKKKAYSHSRSVSREEAGSRKTSRQSSKVESHKSSSSDDDGESVRTSRKTSRQSSRTEVTKRTESESILDNEGLDKDKIRSRQTSESETKQSRRASRQTSRHDETAKDGDDEAEVVSRKTSRQTSRRETKLSVNEEDVDSLRKTISPEPEDGEVIVTSRGKTTSKRKVTVTHDGVENVLEDSTVESSYGNDDRKRLLRGPTIEEGEDESVRKTSKIGDDEAEFLSRKTSRQSSRTEATREISVNEEDEDKDKKKDKIDAKEEVDDVDKLIEQIRAKRASILADDEEDRLTRRTSRQVSKEKTDEEIEQLLARKTSRQMSRNEEVRKIEESGEDDEVKPVEEMSVLERIRRKYSKATPEDDGDSLDLELEKYRPTSRLDDKYNRLISKQSSLVDDQQSRRASKAGDSGDDERTYSRRTSRLGEDEDDLTKVSSRRSSRLNDDELDRPASRRHSRLQDEEDVTKPSRGRLDDDGDKENDIYSRRGSRETSYSRHTSKDESLEIINPDDESGGKLPPASKYSVTDMKRRSSKLEKIADDEILQVTTSSRISKSQRAEVTTSDGSEVLSSRNSSRVDFADVEENGALPSKPSRRSSRSSVGDVSETPKVLSRQTSKLENVEEAESARISHVTSRSSTAELGETPKNLCRQESKVEEIETAKVSRRTSTTASGDLNETPKNLSRQTSKNEDVEEAQSARISRRTSRTSTAELNDSKLSRQTSKVEDVEEAQSAKIRLSSRTSTAELNESTPKNLSRQTSKLEEIEAESVKVSRRSSRASAVDQGGDTPRNLSRQTSKVEDVEEAQTARISRLTSRTSTADLCEAGDQLSRQTSKVEDIEEAQSAKISRRSSRADGDDTPKNLSRQTSKVERVEESQSSKVSRLNSRQSSTADVSETPKNLSRQTSKLGETDVEGKSSRTSRRSSRITGDETPRNLTRQNSIVETVEEPQKPILSRVNSQVSNAELSETPRNLSRRSSKLDKSESDNQEPKNFSRQESKLSRQSSTATENADKPKNLSRQSSILKTPKDSTEDDGSVPKNFSKSRQSSIIEDKAETKTLSRQSSKVDEKPSSLSRKSSRKSTTDAGGESLSRKSSRKTKPANRDSDEISETQSDKSKSAKSLSRQSSKLAESDEKGVPAQIIEEKMDARKVFETLSTVFEVIATGYPHPEAVWYKNGEVLEESERNVITNEGKSYKLEIVRTTHSDAGEYSVVVKNRLGEASSKGSLEIADVKGLRSPRIKTPLESLIIHKYEKAQFTAVVIAFPEPDIKWTIAGKDPQPVVEYIVDTKELDYGLLECTFTLLIPNGHHCHTGDVLFVASNDYGSCETGARLDVLLRPEIQALKDLTCEPYQTTAFEVEIDANPKPRVTWSFKGEKITGTDPRVQVTSEPDQDMYRLTIRNVGLGDEGVYEVEASNNLGVASAIARLKVHQSDQADQHDTGKPETAGSIPLDAEAKKPEVDESSAGKTKTIEPEGQMPAFIKRLDEQTVREYAPLEAKVRADGIPKPVLKWLKNGDIINEEDDDRIRIETTKEGVVTSTLYISHFAPEHVAKYTVIAANLVGEVECFARFRMADHPPMFTRPLNRSLEVQEGHPIELRAQLEASPLAQLRWTKNGEKLLPSDRIEMSSTPDGAVKLSIHEAQLSDSGAYKLFAFNDNGEMHSMCAVVVDPEDKIPSIAQPLSEVLGYEGEPLKLTALIEGFPIPTITWMKDSHILHSGSGCSMVTKPSACGNYTEVSLILPNPGPKDAGRYSFVAQNKLGDAESATRVEIARKETIPRFSLQLNPGKVIEGYPAKLAVKAYAYPEPELQWTFNNHPFIPDGIHSRIITDDDGTQTLLIDKTLPDDAGVYAVMATNNRGTASTRGILDVQPSGRVDQEEQAPGFVHNFKDLTVDEDTPIDFSAPFVGNPIPQVEWFKDGIPLIPSKRLQFTCDGLKVGLNIAKAEPVDAGKYTCTLENKHGKASSSGEIQVRKLYQAPHFLQKFTDQQQLPKRDAKFLARVTGVPTPTVQWYRDGVAIESDDKYRIKRDDEMVCLYVRRCSLDDEAEYKVVAKNREGEVSCEARLKVVDQLEKQEKIEPPSFLKRIGDIEVYPGMSAKFTACMTGYPVPSVEWYKNGEPLEASDKVQIDTESSGILRLTIHRTDLEEDAAIYKCRIWNPHGEATCDAKLLFETLEIRPKAPVGELYSDYDRIRSTGIPLPLADKPIISRMTDRRLTLSWKPSIPYGARYPVTYHVEMCDLPDGDWFTVRMGIRSCACDISNLVPFRDYKFRIRVENKYGLSDPSPFAQTMREKLNPERPKFEPYLPPGVPFHPDKSFYFPRDFDLERPPREGYAQAPRFLNQEHDTQYGIKNENSSLFWFVYGYPKPKVSFYFNDELIEMGGRYDSSYTRNGQATLFINKMLDRDVGMYEALASNEHGTARQRVRLEIAEYPHFIVRPEETYVMMRRTCKLEARIWGVPYPEIKWYKDWKPLTESSRHKIQWIEPDHCVLTIGDCIGRDEGLYSVTARNIAGTISHSVTVHVEDNENEYSYRTYARGRQVKTRTKPITDAYDFGDELGRGVTGIVYHAVERSSGRNYAAKVMTGKGNQYKSLFKNELDIMNQLCHRNLVRLHDSYETKDSFTIISELAGGGELLHSLTRQSYYTEYDIAHYIRQLLSGLDYMHRLSIAHLGLTPGDLLVAHPGGRHLLLTDFGLSRRITSFGKLNPLEYGMPEFVAPEIANGKGVGFAADMWSTGVLTYLLLTGVSLFRGNDDAETLTKVKDGHFMFRREHWENISEEARDFISKLIVVDANTRMDVRQALRHPWLNFADRKPTEDTPKLNTDALRNYYNLYKDWYGNAAVRRYYRRRPLNSCYTHPSRMIYPPGTQFTPEPTPDKVLVSRDLRDVKTWEDNVPNRGPAIDYDLNVVKSESHYQNGPDTYLLQLRDVDFPVRLREYIKVASTRPDLRLSTGFNCLDTSENGHLDWKAPVIRERRRFTDVMDEEIDDERRNRINKYGAADTYTLRRLRHEIGTRPEAHVEADALIESRRDGHAPFFREKPITIPVVIGDKLEMKCLAVGEPKPVIQWFKNELVITESSRIKFREDKDGRCIMTIEPVLNADLGIFKIVARNRKGQTVTRCRVVEATTPMAPDSPEAVDISDTEILLRWKQPSYDGHAPVICYSLQFKEADEVDWITLANNIDHEFWHVKDLKRETNYTFRLSAKNVIGWSEKGIPSALFKTKEQGNGQYKVAVTPAMKHLQAITEAGHTPTLAQDPPPLNYSVEDSPIEWSTEPPTDKYQFISEIHRGKFSVVVKAAEKANTENLVAAKLFEYSHDTLHQVNTEFDNLRSLRHERIASLLEAYKPSTTASNIAVLVMEKLQGADVLSYLSSRHEYTEQNVATIISQVLDGLQYLHWRGLCHLNIEPDNVVMASVRSVQVKLIDLGCTQRVTKLGTLIHPINTPNPEFAAPEVLAEEPIFPQTDVWSAGVLAYVLLSGASPFRGQSEPETRQNVNFVRYRFEYLFKELTQEATRFLMLIFKRAPGKRPTVEECHENRWLVPSEYMIKKRERAVFLGNRLKEFSDEYHDLKNKQFTSDSLSSLHKTLTRSNSIQEELISTAFTSHLVNKPSSDSSTL